MVTLCTASEEIYNIFYGIILALFYLFKIMFMYSSVLLDCMQNNSFHCTCDNKVTLELSIVYWD